SIPTEMPNWHSPSAERPLAWHEGDTFMHVRAWQRLVVLAAVCAGPMDRTAEAAGAQDSSSPSKVTVTLYPLLVRAPIMGATLNLPSVPAPPDGGGGGGEEEVSGSTD